MASVYLDHNATTPLHPAAREAMLPWLGTQHGNPSSIHRFGQAARNAVEEAREKVAALLGARPPEVVFTASGTEANNAVLFHVARATASGHLVISSFEHPSIREAAARLEKDGGFEVTRVSPGTDGVVAAESVLAALRPDTRLVCLMLANNEIGTVQPVAALSAAIAACRERGIPVLCDAVQAVGKIPVSVEALGVDFLTLGAHKFHGPLGAAALWVRKGVEISPLLVGGSQERRRRASTENVPALAGLGAAAAAATAELPARTAHLAALRDAFEAGLPRRVPGALLHCTGSPRLPNTSHVAFPGVEGEALLIRLDIAGFAVSTGSACSSGTVEPSKTLLAIGLSREEALSSLRVSFGMTNRPEEVEAFLAALAREVEAIRRLAPAGAMSAAGGGA
ncbi:MAG TPA: cysteine desulfurase family protein [Thermoanaerobaculia bacterium]|jgi:cysteine desulfurase|nr:cysteine desulfurase family protein [Thermoanaerobaculia bacterium]